MPVSKKQLILDTGKKLFMERGIAATSMEQIAEAAPVSKMTIYNYFNSKEGLVEQIVEQWMNERYDVYRRIMEEAKDPLDALQQFYTRAGLESKDLSVAFVTDLTEMFPQLTDRMLALGKQQILPGFEEMIFRGQQMGQIRKDISPHVLMMFLTFMKQFSLNSGALEGMSDLNTVTEQLTTILYHGIIHPDYKK
ncbi:TetR/AcrR family transcriptional regulator [Paenibacillus gansuensis]|uniref:TetR/AcrR family transcriptional regulator n=1 Tax=Paenibacillus gansuensis TaxID=306542 RepID=A0ABW5PEP7_9BACL